MTERTLIKQSLAEYEDDEISITSSQSEQYTSDQEFLVERILADRKGEDGELSYLIFWANYPEDKSTWEPKENIQDPDILEVWKVRKDQEAKGLKPTFSLAKFNARVQELAQAKEHRRWRREMKRKRLAKPVLTHSRDDDRDSTEAEESDGPPEDYRGIGKKSKVVQKPKRPAKSSSSQSESSSVEGRRKKRPSIQRDSSESDGAGTSDDSLIQENRQKEKRKVKKQALQARRDKGTPGSSNAYRGQEKSSFNKSSERTTTRRPSSGIPLAALARQRQQAQQRSESTDSAISKQLFGAPKDAQKPPITVNLAAISAPSARGRPASRVATRGGSSLGPKNVFSSRTPPKKRPTLTDTMRDPSKDPKHFSNMRIRFLAEKAGRAIADAAPDVSALGGLFAPTHPSTFQPLKPALLRNASNPTPNPQDLNSRDADDLFVRQNSPIGSSTDVWAPTAADLAQTQSHPGQSNPPSRPEYTPGRKSICHFWHSNGHCIKGYQCSYEHTDDIRLPIAPLLSHSTRKVSSDQLPANPQYNPTKKPAATPTLLSDGRPLWTKQHGFKAICNFWFNKNGSCRKGSRCEYLHEDDIHLPIAPAPGKKNEICKYWAAGHCTKKAEYCAYLHGYPDATPTVMRPESRQQPEPTFPAPIIEDGAVTSAPRKSVTFAIDEPMEISDDTENRDHLKPIGGASKTFQGRDSESDQVCLFFKARKCWHGENCRYRHVSDERQTPAGPSMATTLNSETEGTSSHVPALVENQNHGFRPAKAATQDGDSLFPPSSLSRLQTQFDATNTLSPAQENVNSLQSKRTKVQVAFGTDETQFIWVDLGDLSRMQQHPWGPSFATLSRLQFTQSCLAQDFQAQQDSLLRQILWQGSIVGAEPDQAATRVLDKAWEHLRLSSAGFIAICVDFWVLVYPAIEEWKFIEGSASFSPGMRMRYLIFKAKLDLRPTPDTGSLDHPTNYRKALFKAIHGLSFKMFVPKMKLGQKYHFFLLFPSIASKMADFVARWLRDCSSQCRIYSSQTEGAWDAFVKDPKIDIGIVLVHESAIASVCELPSLRFLVAPIFQNKSISFWYISEGTAEYPMYGPPEGSSAGQITATRLLPHGHAFLLTPSFLVAEPEKAYTLLRWFGERDKGRFARSTPGTWKLVCAYNIGQYLLNLAIEESAERDELEAELQGQARKDAALEEEGLSWATCSYRFQLHELIVDLLSLPNTNDYLDYDPDVLDESRSPIIYADESIDADDEQALVTWFAGWAMCRLDRFRKFTVVGTSPSSERLAVRRRRRQVTTRSESNEVEERTASLKPKESSNNEPSNERSMSPTGTKQFRDHPTTSSTSHEATAPGEDPDSEDPDRPSPAESPARTAKPRALAATKFNCPFSASASDASPSNPQGRPSIIKIKGLAAAMSPTGSNLAANRPFPPAQGSGGIFKHQIVGTLGGHIVTLPLTESPDSSAEESDIEMSIDATLSPNELVGPKHGIDMKATPETLQFIASTGENIETAKSYLSRAEDNVDRAIHLYNTETSSHSHRDGIEEALPPPPQFAGFSMFSPQQFDEAGDERPKSSGANSAASSLSGIQSDETGRRFVPTSIRSGGTIRPEINIKAGYIPSEDRDRYRAPHRRQVDGEGSATSSRAISGQGTPVNTALDRMHVDSSGVDDRGEVVTGSPTAEMPTKDIRFEATTTWYGRWYREGKGWEHIYVESWEKAWKYLGVK